ncbi:MAG: hypothetical protein IKY19_06510 [Bacteroidaceae bacterium]|nr:hypothetical protein [Bacteroidaceae bacterium]
MTNKLNISQGNIKMGAIPSVSLPPIKTCRADAPCKKDCYACRMCRYKNVRNAYENNLELYNSDPDSYFNQLCGAFMMSRYFRMHVSGDIPCRDYFARLIIAARRVPTCEILIFTKQYEIVNTFIDDFGSAIPANLHVIFSNWGPWKTENPHSFPETDVINTIDDLPAGGKLCGGNCTECVCRGVGCWELKQGEKLYFIKH